MAALDPATLHQGIGGEDIPSLHEPPVERHADERPGERDDDREDDTDRAIKLARSHAVEAVQYLAGVMVDLAKTPEDRSRAAISLLEVAGCL